MKLLVALAICAVYVSGEEKASQSLKREKRGWGYETTPGWTTPPPTKGWAEPTTGWGWQPPTTQGWGWQPPSNGWGSGGGGGSIYQNYPVRGYPYQQRPMPYRGSGGSRYGRGGDDSYRNRYYRSVSNPSLI